MSYYDEVGGAPVFHQLVHEFYRGVADDPELLALYPNMDTVNATASYVGPTAGATLVRNAILSSD